MKKGQIQPIFTWIFVLIVAVAVLFFGIKVVKQGENLKDEVLLVDFYKNLEKRINNYYYLDIDSSGREEFNLPNGVEKVCFINQPGAISSVDLNANDESYVNSLTEFSNVFVFPNEFKQSRVNLTNFIVPDPGNIECASVIGGRLEIKFTNKGRVGVEIEEP